MKIDSARALKAEMLEQVVKPLMTEAVEGRRFSLSASSLKRSTGVERGIALGITAGKGKRDYRLAVRIQRRALDSQAVRERIEAAARREADIRYVGRVTKVVGGLAASPWHQVRQRPLLIGCSIGHYAITAGTLGTVALHRKTRRPVLVSNNHVFANEDKGKLGDPIIQPGVYDTGQRSRDVVGELLDFVPLKKSANFVDAAVSAIREGVTFDPKTLTGFGELHGLRGEPIEPGDEVIKIGRTTGLTRGLVTAIELDDVVVEFDRGEISFDRQIEIEGAGDDAFSAGGDSGSLIIDANGHGLGLLFAASDQGGTDGKGLTNANELLLVLDQLNLELDLQALTS